MFSCTKLSSVTLSNLLEVAAVESSNREQSENITQSDICSSSKHTDVLLLLLQLYLTNSKLQNGFAVSFTWPASIYLHTVS